MKQRIPACFDAAGRAGRKVLIPFITAGDPDPDWTVAVMHALVEAGADMIELGVPFSDPMADGPVIQLASERAIEKGVTVCRVLEIVKADDFFLDMPKSVIVDSIRRTIENIRNQIIDIGVDIPEKEISGIAPAAP